MSRTHATRFLRRTVPTAAGALLVAALVGGLMASARADGTVTIGTGRGVRAQRGTGIRRSPVGQSHLQNDAFRRMQAIRQQRVNSSSVLRSRPSNSVLRSRPSSNLLRTLPHSSLLRRSGVGDTHLRLRFGDEHGHSIGSRRDREHRPGDRDHRPGDRDHRPGDRDHHKGRYPHGRTILPWYRPYPYPYGRSVIISVPGGYYRSYSGTIYTVPGTGWVEERVEVVPEPERRVEPQVRVAPDPRLDPGIEVPPEALAAAATDHGAAATQPVWDLLRGGRSAEALTAFSQIGQAIRAAGVPKIGAALSLAMLEQFDRGAWAMRRAIRLDPEAVAHVPVDDALRERLDRLVQQYRRSGHHGILAKDATFMLAVLHGLCGEWGAAHEMIDLAREVGDTSEAAAVYRQYLDAVHPRQ